ncbi:MAG: hypothetical protein ACHP8A_08600 [Terriglobales bacterium]|jgi:hypothetical protein
MKLHRLAVVFAVAVLSAIPSVPAFAQEKPGNVTLVVEMTPKPGAEKQFEAGLKQLSTWYASNNDPQSCVVFVQITGENMGTYSLVRQWMHWADLDNPVPSEEQMHAEIAKAMGDTVAKRAVKVYEEIPELNHSSMDHPAKYYEIDTFHVPLDKQDQFATAVGRLREAIEKTKSPMNISWLALTEGGEFGTWVLAIGHDSSADFGSPTPDEVLNNAFGKDEANSIANQISALIGGHFTEEVIEFRPDLSYFPKK